MDYESRLAISYYKEIGTINSEHNIYIVQHIETKKVYVKKVSSVYNLSVYQQLKDMPILGVPKVIELCVEDDKLIVIEEYISGYTIEEKLYSNSTFTLEEICSYTLQLCQIVNRLHKATPSIIHRDIKPSNVMIAETNSVVLLDFNAAKHLSANKYEDTTLLGTKGYAAPEQYGFGTSDVRTDIYAIGMLMKFMRTGNIEAPMNPNDSLYSIIDKCTKLDSKSRYKSIIDLAKALSSVMPSGKKTINNTTDLVQSDSRDLLPPGFRTMKPQNMIISSIVYAFILWFGLTLQTTNQTTMFVLIYERIFFILVCFAMILFSCNYLNIQAKVPFCKSRNPFIRILSIVIYDVLLAVVIITIMILGEMFLKSIGL